MKFQIRFDGPPGPQSGRFIETEDAEGRGIRIGEWCKAGSDWLLKIDTMKADERLYVDPSAPFAEQKHEHNWSLLGSEVDKTSPGPRGWWHVKMWWGCSCGEAKYQTAMAVEE